jgi:hypothetical protein
MQCVVVGCIHIQTLHKPCTCRTTSAAPTLCMQHQALCRKQQHRSLQIVATARHELANLLRTLYMVVGLWSCPGVATASFAQTLCRQLHLRSLSPHTCPKPVRCAWLLSSRSRAMPSRLYMAVSRCCTNSSSTRQMLHKPCACNRNNTTDACRQLHLNTLVSCQLTSAWVLYSPGWVLQT